MILCSGHIGGKRQIRSLSENYILVRETDYKLEYNHEILAGYEENRTM